MSVLVQVSIGEALDKYSILRLKSEFITDPSKLKDIKYEMDLLEPLIGEYLNREGYKNLYNINKSIWMLSEGIRCIDVKNPEYMSKLVLIMSENDERYRIKNVINKATGSLIKEHKSYTINYVCGGRLGDLVHSIYPIMINYIKTGKKGNLYITDNYLQHHGKFSTGVQRTYNEMYDIVMAQEYINKFEILDTSNIPPGCVDLSIWYNSDQLYKTNWCHLVTSCHGLEEIPQKWLTLPQTDTKLLNQIVIHRGIQPVNNFPWESILKKNKCFFITCNRAEYDSFAWKHLVELHLCQNLKEMAEAINNSKLFIGNQSSPLAFACALHKPCLAELISFGGDNNHYRKETKNNPHFYWIWNNIAHVNGINKFMNISNWFTDGILNIPPKSLQVDMIINEYFSDTKIGTCIDVGACLPIWGSNTYIFEKRGWKCICIEPIPLHCVELRKERKYVEECACDSENGEDKIFEVVHLNGWEHCQGAVSSLKIDERLIESHKHLLKSKESIRVKVKTLDRIIDEHKLDQLDFVSIDTENTELDVLKGFDINKWKPHLLIIENNYNEPMIEEYLKPFGYSKIERVSVNDFYKYVGI